MRTNLLCSLIVSLLLATTPVLAQNGPTTGDGLVPIVVLIQGDDGAPLHIGWERSELSVAQAPGSAHDECKVYTTKASPVSFAGPTRYCASFNAVLVDGKEVLIDASPGRMTTFRLWVTSGKHTIKFPTRVRVSGERDERLTRATTVTVTARKDQPLVITWVLGKNQNGRIFAEVDPKDKRFGLLSLIPQGKKDTDYILLFSQGDQSISPGTYILNWEPSLERWSCEINASGGASAALAQQLCQNDDRTGWREECLCGPGEELDVSLSGNGVVRTAGLKRTKGDPLKWFQDHYKLMFDRQEVLPGDLVVIKPNTTHRLSVIKRDPTRRAQD